MQEELLWQKMSAVLFGTGRVRSDTATAHARAYQDQEDRALNFGTFLGVSTCNRPEL